MPTLEPLLTTQNIVNIITAIGVIVTFILAVRKSPHDIMGMDANTAQIYQKIAEEAAENELKKSIEIKNLKLKVDFLERQVKILRSKLFDEQARPFELEIKIGILEKKVDILKEQLIAAGIEPKNGTVEESGL